MAVPSPLGIGTPQAGAGSYFAPVTAINPATVPPVGVVQPIMPANIPSIATPGLVAPAPSATAPTAAPSGATPVQSPAPVGTGGVRPVREAVGRFRDRVRQDGPVRDFVSDFAAGVAQPTEGGPLAAFLGGFAGAVGSDRSREAARAQAAIDAEERAYQRSRDALGDKRDDRADARADRALTLTEERDRREAEQAQIDAKIERDRIEADRERDRLLNEKTAAEIANLTRAAGALLTPADLEDINTQSTNFYNARRQALIGNGFMPLNAEQLAALDREYQQFKADLTEQYLVANGHSAEDIARLGGGASPAPGATGGPAEAAAPAVDLPTFPGVNGAGSREQPYVGATPTQIRTAYDRAPPGAAVYYVDAQGQMQVVIKQ